MGKTIRVCPKCGSTNIGPGVGVRVISGGMCNDCGHGSVQHEPVNIATFSTLGYATFPEINEEDVEKFRKSLKKIKQ